MLRAVGLGSLVMVPLAVGDQTLGALTLARGDAAAAVHPADVELAEELGRRAGTAVLNARLYTERAAIAETLQRGLRPPELLEMPGFARRDAAIDRPARSTRSAATSTTPSRPATAHARSSETSPGRAPRRRC